VFVCLFVCVCERERERERGGGWRRKKTGETGVTVDRDKIEFRLFNSSSIFNKPLGKEVTLHQRFY